jgi:hypothetical protein
VSVFDSDSIRAGHSMVTKDITSKNTTTSGAGTISLKKGDTQPVAKHGTVSPTIHSLTKPGDRNDTGPVRRMGDLLSLPQHNLARCQ